MTSLRDGAFRFMNAPLYLAMRWFGPLKVSCHEEQPSLRRELAARFLN